MINICLDDKLGNLWDVSSLVTDVTWKTSRIGSPSSLEFTLVKGGLYESRSFSYSNGDIVRLRFKDIDIFYGYIFIVDNGKDEAVKITAYDQIRYLMATDTYVFSGVTAADIIKRIAEDFGLRLGRIDTPDYVIPRMVEDGQKLIDIIDKALTLTLIHSGDNYVLFDDFGVLSLRLMDDLLVDFVVGDGSLMYNYSFKQSIDQDTYNRIKLVQDNKDSGGRDVYIAQDSANVAKWGMLQLYQKVDDDQNAAQINELLTTLATLKNRETKTLQIDAIGQPNIRAGCYVSIIIEEFGINQPFVVESCTHSFSGSHTMSLELKVI